MSGKSKAEELVLAFSRDAREEVSKRKGSINWTRMTWEERLQTLQEQVGTRDAGNPQNASTPSTPNNAAALENFDAKLQELERRLVSRLEGLFQEQAGTRDAGDAQHASTPSTPNNAAASENFDDKLQRLEQSLVSRLEGLEKASKQAGRSDEEDPQKASTQEKEEEVELQVMVKKEKIRAQRSAPAQKKEEKNPPSTPNNPAASENFEAELQKLKKSLESRLEELEKASKPEANQPFRIAHDDHYRTLAEHALDPKVGSTETVGASLMNQIKLPECVNTSVWLTPLIDSRMWYGEPEKKFVDLPLHLQEKYANDDLKEGSTTI
jgi:hypothetical protein